VEEWRTIRRKRPLNEERVGLYRRVVEADARLSSLQIARLRRRRGVSQALVADALDVSQPNISRIEQQDDLYLSTLARYVAALGGELELRAVFPDETVTLLGSAPPFASPPG
jgi:DNA-binding XRE family transcriptional regulator